MIKKINIYIPSFSSLTGLKVKPELYAAGSLFSPTVCHKMTPGETLMSEEMGQWHRIRLWSILTCWVCRFSGIVVIIDGFEAPRPFELALTRPPAQAACIMKVRKEIDVY